MPDCGARVNLCCIPLQMCSWSFHIKDAITLYTGPTDFRLSWKPTSVVVRSGNALSTRLFCTDKNLATVVPGFPAPVYAVPLDRGMHVEIAGMNSAATSKPSPHESGYLKSQYSGLNYQQQALIRQRCTGRKDSECNERNVSVFLQHYLPTLRASVPSF